VSFSSACSVFGHEAGSDYAKFDLDDPPVVLSLEPVSGALAGS